MLRDLLCILQWRKRILAICAQDPSRLKSCWMFGMERTLLVFKFSPLIDVDLIGTYSGLDLLSTNLARDTATANIDERDSSSVDFDTYPTYEYTTEKAVIVVSPLNTLISDQMEHRKSLKVCPKVYT